MRKLLENVGYIVRIKEFQHGKSFHINVVDTQNKGLDFNIGSGSIKFIISRVPKVEPPKFQLKEVEIKNDVELKLKSVGKLLFSDFIEISEEAQAASIVSKLINIFEQRSKFSMKLLENVPFFGDIKDVVIPALVVLACKLSPENEFSKKASVVGRYAYRGNLHSTIRPLADKISNLIAEVSKVYDLLPKSEKII